MSSPASKYDMSRSDMLGFVPLRSQRVLDVGCDTGRFGELLIEQRGPSVKVFGVEPSEIFSAHQDAYEEIWQGAFPEVVPREQRFDCIAMNDVLEHMADPWAALAAAWEMLSPGGVLVGSVPNIRQIAVLSNLVLRGDFTYREVGILDRGHLRFFTQSTLRAALIGANLNVVELRGSNIPQTRKIYRVLKQVVPRISGEFLARQIVFMAEKNPCP
ncbi:MAG: methyltransferase domain-containing protein [Actinobacteria bacterium]|nr:methyltransferase domain-containing protein [Actinomycetota bacterium]